MAIMAVKVEYIFVQQQTGRGTDLNSAANSANEQLQFSITPMCLVSYALF